MSSRVEDIFYNRPIAQCFKKLSKKPNRRIDRISESVELFKAMTTADVILWDFSITLSLWNVPKWKRVVLAWVLKLLKLRVFDVSSSRYGGSPEAA